MELVGPIQSIKLPTLEASHFRGLAMNSSSTLSQGKLLQSQKRMEEAVSWYEKAAVQGNPYAAYRLGKLYLEGTDVLKNVAKAVEYLSDALKRATSMRSTPWVSCTSPARM